MNDETIFDQNEVKNEKQGLADVNDDTTAIDEPQPTPENETARKPKRETHKTAGIAGAAAVAGTAIGVLTPVSVFPDAPNGNEVEIDVDETGQTAPSPASHLQGQEMPVATGVEDSMSFNQAFAAARQEVGAGGLFVWHGNTYGTYYANEWNAMTPEEHNQYWADVHHTTSGINEEIAQNDEGTDVNADPASVSDPDELDDNGLATAEPDELGDDNLATAEPDEPDDDGLAVVEPVELDDDGLATVEPDELGDDDLATVEPVELDDDGLVAVEPVESDEDLDFDIDEPIVTEPTDDDSFGSVDLDEGMDLGSDDFLIPDEVDLLDDALATDNPDIDNFASIGLDPDIPIDNDMDMGEFV